GIGNLTGNAHDDTFKVNPGGTLSGTITGGAGTDTLNFDVVMVLTGSDGTGYAGTADGIPFTGVNVVSGNGSADSLQGENVASTWALGATQKYNDGLGHGDLTFAGFETLQGGTDVDTFNVSAVDSTIQHIK